MSATTNYLGRCKECDYVIFATSADVQDAEGWRDVRSGAGVFRVGNNGCFARCTKGHKFFACKVVKGTYSEDHKCDSRCLNAKGWSCTCSCGGANHGRGHVATVTQASDLPPVQASPKFKHLGKVGAHITGEARVSDVRELDRSTLYTFTTVNGGHIIKWFAPNYVDVAFEVGHTFKLRAKVKAHKDFQGTPETHVIYVEEVD
jgi:hypothetical protein